MAPINTSDLRDDDVPMPKTVYDINLPYSSQDEEYASRISQRTEFPGYLPTWENKVWFDEVLPFDFQDPALRADQKMPNLFKSGVKFKHITPKMGTVLSNVKLEELSNAARDELALLISNRKIVVFRDQLGFLNSGPQFQQDFMAHYGKLSYQPVSGSVKDFPAFHIIHRDDNEEEIATFFQHRATSTLWHHDVSYERQPPGYVMLGILACPDTGGDTVFADTVEAYKRLSPTFQNMINGLQARHSSRNMINHVKASKGAVRADPIDSVHPVVRVHPVTGDKAIYLNAEFLTGIEGLKDQETDLLVKFLVSHVCMGHDFQARVQWEKHSVVMFDGRTTLHTATVDYDTRAQARHIFRLAAMTEKPISVAGAELAIAENDMEYESSLSLPPAFNGLRELSPLTQGFRKSLPSNRYRHEISAQTDGAGGGESHLPPGMRDEARKIVTNSIMKDTVIITKYGLETQGEYTKLKVAVAPSGDGIPLHYHLAYTETFQALNQALYLRIGVTETPIILEPRESRVIAKKEIHRFYNLSSESNMRFRVTIRPASEGVEKTFFGLFSTA